MSSKRTFLFVLSPAPRSPHASLIRHITLPCSRHAIQSFPTSAGQQRLSPTPLSLQQHISSSVANSQQLPKDASSVTPHTPSLSTTTSSPLPPPLLPQPPAPPYQATHSPSSQHFPNTPAKSSDISLIVTRRTCWSSLTSLPRTKPSIMFCTR